MPKIRPIRSLHPMETIEALVIGAANGYGKAWLVDLDDDELAEHVAQAGIASKHADRYVEKLLQYAFNRGISLADIAERSTPPEMRSDPRVAEGLKLMKDLEAGLDVDEGLVERWTKGVFDAPTPKGYTSRDNEAITPDSKATKASMDSPVESGGGGYCSCPACKDRVGR